MEKKKSFNLITLIFVGIVCILAIVIGFAINKINNEKEVAKKDAQQLESEIQEEEKTKDENQNTKISQETEAENALPEIDNEEQKFSHLKIYPDKEFVFSKEYKTYGECEEYTLLEWPVINLKFAEVEKINSKLEEFYNKNKDSYSDETKKSKHFSDSNYHLPSLSCQYTLINNILEIYTIRYDDDGFFEEYYYIDIENEKMLSNEEFLYALGINKENLEDLINDSFLTSYYYESSTVNRFNETYKNFEDFKNSIKFVNGDTSEKYKYDFEKICDFCNIHYNEFGNNIYIYGISIPIYIDEENVITTSNSISIDLNKKYVFSKIYNYDLYMNPGYEYSNVYNELPVINFNSEDAKKINKELEEYFEKIKNTVEKNGGSIIISPVDVENITENSQTFTLKNELILNKDGKVVIDEYYTMKYSHMIYNEKILSIVVEQGVNTYSNLAVEGLVENPKTVIYNFDIETGKLLSNEEFLEMCGIKLEDFKEKLDKNLTAIDYNVDTLKIAFEEPSKLLYEPVYNFENRIQEVNKLVVLGENFINFPYNWITINLEDNNN